MHFPLVILAFVLDVLALAAVLAGSWILATGGGTIHIAGATIRAYTLRNPALFLAVVTCLRASLLARAPRFLAVPAWDLRSLPAALVRLVAPAEQNTPRARNRVIVLVLTIIAISTVIKLLNAWFHFGFYSGDDVEIQEMAFSHLFGYPWVAWDLRNAFYPMVFVYPVQAALHALGVTDTAVLVFAARALVAVAAAVSMWLVFLAARREFPAGAAVAAVALLALNKLHVAFASTELPRPVAAAFLVGAYLLLQVRRSQESDAAARGEPPRAARRAARDGSLQSSIAAAVLLGVAASLRFSEVIFFVPAVLALVLAGRWRHAIVVGLVATATAAAILALSDTLYWKHAFFSTRNIVDYTLLKGLSSRGYQSTFYYLTSLGTWTDVVTAVFALIGICYAPRLALWFVAPLALLCCLPHKESRYLVPLMPFYAMLAGVGLWKVGTVIREAANAGRRGMAWAALLLLACALLALVRLEVEGFRFRRSESAVEVARFLAAQRVPMSIGIEDTFKAGATLYLREPARFEQIAPEIVRLGPDAMARRLRDRHLDYLALTDEDVRAHGYVPALAELGFAEVDYGGKVRYDRFRLFRRVTR